MQSTLSDANCSSLKGLAVAMVSKEVSQIANLRQVVIIYRRINSTSLISGGCSNLSGVFHRRIGRRTPTSHFKDAQPIAVLIKKHNYRFCWSDSQAFVVYATVATLCSEILI